MNEYYFNKIFIDILIKCINDKKLNMIYNINNNIKYNINYILDIVLLLSIKNNNRYALPKDILTYFNLSHYVLITKGTIKNYLKKQINNNNIDTLLKTYIIIGNTNPIIIKNLTVII